MYSAYVTAIPGDARHGFDAGAGAEGRRYVATSFASSDFDSTLQLVDPSVRRAAACSRSRRDSSCETFEVRIFYTSHDAMLTMCHQRSRHISTARTSLAHANAPTQRTLLFARFLFTDFDALCRVSVSWWCIPTGDVLYLSVVPSVWVTATARRLKQLYPYSVVVYGIQLLSFALSTVLPLEPTTSESKEAKLKAAGQLSLARSAA